MKKQFSVSVSFHCSERRDTFLPVLNGGLYSSYQRKKPVSVTGWNILRAGMLGLALMLTSQQLSAARLPVKSSMELQVSQKDQHIDRVPEDLTVSGMVRDENGAPFPGVNIYLQKDNTTGTTSDENGKFKLSGNIQSGDVIIFSFLGYEPVEYVVIQPVPEFLEISLTDFHVMMGEVQEDEPYQKGSQMSHLWQKVKNIF